MLTEVQTNSRILAEYRQRTPGSSSLAFLTKVVSACGFSLTPPGRQRLCGQPQLRQ